jgi:O-antigen ligase
VSGPAPLHGDAVGSQPHARLAAFACLACLLVPWLNPLSGGPSVSVEPWLVSALCVAIAFGWLRSARLQPGTGMALAALAAWALVRTGFTSDAVALAAACLVIFMAASLAAGGVGRPEFVRALALAWLLAALLSTAMAWVQYFGQAQRFAPWISTSAIGEAYANLRQRNQFASLTVIGMASLLWLAPSGPRRWPALLAMCWLASGNAATTSRTGLMQMLVLSVLACSWPGPRRERAGLWLAGLLAYGLAAVLLPAALEAATGAAGNRLWERVASVDACSSRTVLWSNVLHLIAQHPWAGWGWGDLDYAHYMTLYEGTRFCDILDNAHNLPLHLAVELGLPAALLACGGVVWAVARGKPWAEADPARQMAWAVLAVIGIHSMLEYPLWYGPFQIALGLCLGLLWPRAASAAAPRESRLPASRVFAVMVCLACAYAFWDYWRVSQIYLAPESRAPDYREDPLSKIRDSWLFRSQARFAELTLTPLTRENAAWTYENALALLRYSPEPRIIEKVIESGVMLGRDDEVLAHIARLRAAFPEAYAEWSRSHTPTAAPR